MNDINNNLEKLWVQEINYREMKGEEVRIALSRSLNEKEVPERVMGAIKNGLTKWIFWR